MMAGNERDLLTLIIDLMDYDFCEDHEDVQGTWEVTRTGNTVTVTYNPFNDAPHPAERMTYRLKRIDNPTEMSSLS